MGKSNYTQTSFLGGEFSPLAQGRSDLPVYGTALAACLNAIPIEEGAWCRRSGTQDLGPSHFGRPGIIRRYEFTDNSPVKVEFTFGSGSSALRFWYFDGFHYKLAYNDTATVTAISTANPAVMTISGAAVVWNTGDIVYFEVDQSINLNIAPQLANRQFVVTKITNTTFSLTDMLTGAAVDGSILNAGSGLASTQVRRVSVIGGPFTSLAETKAIDFVQADNVAFLLSGARLPQLLTLTPGSPPTFSLQDAGFSQLDGPYLDALPGSSQTFNSTATISAPSNPGPGGIGMGAGTATFHITDGAYSFTASDVGRCIRFWNQPPLWSAANTYANSDCVTWNGTYWRRGASTPPAVPQDQPGLGVQFSPAAGVYVVVFPWDPAPTIATWGYATITGFTDSSHVTVTIAGSNGNGNWSAGGPTADIGNGPVIDTWQLGAFGGTANINPSAGTFHEGRLWLGGAYGNRFDASQPLRILPSGAVSLNFSPTSVYGQVLPNSGINYTLNSPGVNKFRWMRPSHQGILIGTQSGEWLISSSNLSNPLTPTDIQAKKTSTYKCSSSKTVLSVGAAIVFIQASTRRVMEYIADVFSGKFIGRHLNKYAKHLGTAGFTELAYQEELAPIVWAIDKASQLSGCTYRRVSQFGQEEPVFYGWHRHIVGDGLGPRALASICSLSANSGALDTLAMLTADINGHNFLSLLSPTFDAAQTLAQGRFLDSYLTGHAGSGFGGVSAYDPSLYGGAAGLKINGLWYKIGQTASVSILGLYCGDFTVAADGSVFVPYQSDSEKLLTPAYLNAASSGSAYGDLSTQIEVNNNGTKQRPIVSLLVGTKYLSQGQLLSPENEQQIKGKTGPGLSKRRRIERWGAKFVNTVGNQTSTPNGLSIGTDSSPVLYPIIFYGPDENKPLDNHTLFTGVVQELVDDNYDFSGMLLWQLSLPYPCNVASVSVFLTTEDI